MLDTLSSVPVVCNGFFFIIWDLKFKGTFWRMQNMWRQGILAQSHETALGELYDA